MIFTGLLSTPPSTEQLLCIAAVRAMTWISVDRAKEQKVKRRGGGGGVVRILLSRKQTKVQLSPFTMKMWQHLNKWGRFQAQRSKDSVDPHMPQHFQSIINELTTKQTAVFNISPNFKTCGLSPMLALRHTHSNNQYLDFVLFVGSIKERDARVLAKEWGWPGSSLGVLDLMEELHDLLGCTVLFGHQGLGFSLNKSRWWGVQWGGFETWRALKRSDGLHGFYGERSHLWNLLQTITKYSPGHSKLFLHIHSRHANKLVHFYTSALNVFIHSLQWRQTSFSKLRVKILLTGTHLSAIYLLRWVLCVCATAALKVHDPLQQAVDRGSLFPRLLPLQCSGCTTRSSQPPASSPGSAAPPALPDKQMSDRKEQHVKFSTDNSMISHLECF